MPDYTFAEYGMGTRYGYTPPALLHHKYKACSVTLHFKHMEGFGFSLIQSLACGTPAIVPRGFYKYRTAGRYLIPGVTCLEADWDAESIQGAIQEITGDEDRYQRWVHDCGRVAGAIIEQDRKMSVIRLREFMRELK